MLDVRYFLDSWLDYMYTWLLIEVYGPVWWVVLCSNIRKWTRYFLNLGVYTAYWLRMNILNIMNYSHLKFRPLDIEFARDREGWLKFPLMLQLFGAKIPMRTCGHGASQWMLCSLSRHHLFDINVDEFKVMYVMLVCVLLLKKGCFHGKNGRSSI